MLCRDGRSRAGQDGSLWNPDCPIRRQSLKVRTMGNRRGFTLLELLVVIAIIGILAIMVAANWQNLRLHAQRTASLSNLRQIGAGFFAYAGENEMRLPRRVVDTNDSSKWPRLIAEYLGDV